MNKIPPQDSFCQRIIASANAHHDNIAMTLIEPHSRETVTFGSMLAQVRSIAYRLTQENIGFGERVALIGENHPNWAIAYLGIIYRGAVVTPLDPTAATQALAAFLKSSEAKLAFVTPASLDKFRSACELSGVNIPVVALRPLVHGNGLAEFADWSQTPVPKTFEDAPPPAKAEDLALLMYTSGTTGIPKAVPLTHGNIYAESDKIQEVMQLSDQEVVLSLLPLFHAYSQIVNLWLVTTVGGQVVYLKELNTAGIEQGLKDSGATALVGVPRLWYLFHKKIWDEVTAKRLPVRLLFRIMLSVNGLLRDWLGLNAGRWFFGTIHRSFGGKLRLAVSGGASFDVAVARDFHRLGFTILQGYGLTETCGAATVTRFEDNEIGSVGTPLNGVEVKIDQPDDAGVGEVLIRGPIVMSGYYRNPEANKAAFTGDGWFRTGDLGRMDKRQHLYIAGRKKDIVKLPSGKNVFPEDVEAHYEQSPFVSEVCVLGVKDEASQFERAEKLCAIVVPDFDYLRSQHAVNAREWVVWELENLGRELPEYQRVHDFILRAEPLPRTTTRKLKRFELAGQLQALRRQSNGHGAIKVSEISEIDQALLDSPGGRATIAAVRQHIAESKVVQPQMNLEIDLGLDSLARAECLVSIEQSLGIQLKPEEIVDAQTVAELACLANTKLGNGPASGQLAAAKFCWRDALAQPSLKQELPEEARALLKPKPGSVVLAYAVLRLIYLLFRLLFRLEVRGIDVLARVEPPYLICPNHQSYLDPFIVCSTYPRRVLSKVFHVGASMFFTNAVMAQVARLINVVPIDPDTHLLRAMRAGAAGLSSGRILTIYPEGQRSFDGDLLEFKKGAAILATEMNVPIVPVALDGAYQIWPRYSGRFHFAKLRIVFGNPIEPQELTAGLSGDAAYEKLTQVLQQRIQQMLNEMRGINKIAS